jgi:nucleoside phosphorylase
MIGLIFATAFEARPFLSANRAIKLQQRPFAIYRIEAQPWLHVAISGMGKVAAATACQYMIRELKMVEIINAGACGALQDGKAYQPGALFCVASAVEGDHELFGKAPRLWISDGGLVWDLPSARLITCDRAVFDVTLRAQLSDRGDLVDMEGAAIARVAAMFDTPWTMLKGVTDAAGPTDRETLMKNLTMVSEKIASCLGDNLKAMERIR